MAGEVLNQMAQGFAPVASGYQPQFRTGMEGVPLAQSHPLLGMMAQPHVQRMMNGMGLVPMGLGHDQNLYDVLRHRNYMAMQQQAMSNVAFLDRENMMRTLRGFSAMAGVPFGAAERRSAGHIADAFRSAAPLLGMVAPEMLDAMGGMRGSGVVMAQQMMMGGRYMVDPLTGRLGMDSAAVGRMAGQMYQDLYSPANLHRMHGLSAGQAGALFNQLAQRGMIGQDPMGFDQRFGRAVGMLTPHELAQAAARQGVTLPTGPHRPGQHGFSAADMDRLSLDPAVGDRMRGFDASRITRAIQGYSRAVAAMRDIFGDMGRPNAPMAELMQSLEAMTNGSLSQMDPNRAARMVRQTYNLARGSGVSLDAAMMMQQHASQHAAALGLEPVFGVHATQGSLAFGGAYRGRGLGAVTGWGVFNADQMQQLDSNLRNGAAASSQANRLAVAMRLAQSGGGFAQGTAAANMVNALRGGFAQFDAGGGRVLNVADLNQQQFYGILTGSRLAGGGRVSEGDVREMLGQTHLNHEQIDAYNLGGLVRGQQGRQVNHFLAGRLRETLAQRLREAGLSDRDARASLGGVRGAMDDIAALAPEVRTNGPARDEAIAEILQRRLRGTAAGAMLDRMSAGERAGFLGLTAGRFWGRANEGLRRSAYRGYGSVENALRANDPTTLRMADEDQMRRSFEGQLQDALSPLGRGSAMRRFFDALQTARPGDNVATIVGNTLGVRAEDINSAITTPMQQLAGRARQVAELQRRLARAAPGAERDGLQRQLNGMLREIRAEASGVARTAMDHGFFGEGTVTARDTREALDLQLAVVHGIQDASGMRTGMGLAVGGVELNRVRDAGRGAMDAADLRNVIVARRLASAGTVSEADLTAASDRLMADNPGMTREAARAMARRQITAFRQRFAGSVSPEDVAAERAATGRLSDTEVQAVILGRRGRTPLRPTEEAVRAHVAAHPGVREEDARELLTSRLRAQRFGVDLADVRRDARQAGVSEREMIDRHIAAADAAQYQVTPEQRRAARDYARTQGNAALAGASDSQVDAYVLGERRRLQRGRFGNFWASEDGAMFREHVDMMMDQNTTVGERLVMNRDVTRRLGTQAVDFHRRLRDINQRRRVLAQRYAGGSVARLLAGDYEGVTDAATADRVRHELMELHGAERDIYGRIHGTHGRTGRQFRVADRHAAEESLRARGETVTDANVAREQDRLGDLEEARRLAGLPATGSGIVGRIGDAAVADTARLVGIARRMTGRDELTLRASRGRDTQAVRDLAARLTGGDVAMLRRVQSQVLDPQLAMADAYRRRVTQGGGEVVRDLAAAFGVSEVAGDRRGEELARQIGSSPQARAMGQYFIWTQQRVAGAARDLRGGGGEAALARRYREAMAREGPARDAAVRDLQRDLGIDASTGHGRRRWEEVSEALDWQRRHGLLEGREGGRMTMARLAEAWERMRRSGERLPSQGPGGGLPGSMNVRGTLDVRLRGDGTGTGDINASTSGSPSNVTAPS